MSFNFRLKNTNVSCAPMYNSQNPDEVYGYLCNPQQRTVEGFQDIFKKSIVEYSDHITLLNIYFDNYKNENFRYLNLKIWNW